MSYFTSKYYILGLAYAIFENHCTLMSSPGGLHFKDTILKIWNKNSQKRNCAASVPMFTFKCLWVIYILPGSFCLFSSRKIHYVEQFWEYLKRSQTQECGNWDGGRAISCLEIHKWIFVAVCERLSKNLCQSHQFVFAIGWPGTHWFVELPACTNSEKAPLILEPALLLPPQAVVTALRSWEQSNLSRDQAKQCESGQGDLESGKNDS